MALNKYQIAGITVGVATIIIVSVYFYKKSKANIIANTGNTGNTGNGNNNSQGQQTQQQPVQQSQPSQSHGQGIQYGSRGRMVANLQKILNFLNSSQPNYVPLVIDGIFGDKTQAAAVLAGIKLPLNQAGYNSLVSIYNSKNNGTMVA